MRSRFLAVLPAAVLLCACDPEAASSPSDPLETERLSGGATQPSASIGSGVSGTGTLAGGTGGAGQGGGSSSSDTGAGGPGNGGAGGTGEGGDSSSITVGVGGAGACEGGVASIAAGANDRILLRGTIVTPTGILDGEVLVDGDTITCVAASCASESGADGATIVDTGGYIYPGLIDGHNHILFDIFDEDDWAPAPGFAYEDHLGGAAGWSDDPDYELVVDAKQAMNGEAGSDIELGCELDKYGEMKALIAGTTSVQASPGTSKNCYGSLTRTIDGANDLPADLMQTATIFPSDDAVDTACENFADGSTTSYVIHLGEGVSQRALDEWGDLETAGTADPGCLVDGRTTVVHGTAFTVDELTTMGDLGMSIVWSPKSNIFLYGAGTDTSKTTDIPTALAQGINVCLGPDWSLGGSVNMLDEMRYADAVDDSAFGDILTPKDVFDMATINAARAFRVDAYVGSLAAGKRADLFVLPEIAADPYDAVLQALPRDVVLTMVDGKVLYGDADLQSLGPAGNTCETFDVCCASKFACIAENGGSAADRLDQTFAEITTALEAGLTEVAPQFMPLAPIVKCP